MASHQPAKRLLSLDVFRGITIAGMIVVNSPGNESTYSLLRHSQWHGFTPADLVFPGFLFIMGVSLAVSLGRRRERGESLPLLLSQILWRSAVIFTLGLVISSVLTESFASFRIFGVLQRIALCYCFCGLLFLGASPPAQALAALGILSAYWFILTRMPVPGYGPADLTPEGNIASYLDRLLLGGHLYAERFDPEGILSTLPSMATALCGVLAGQWLRSKRMVTRKALIMAEAGAALAAAGWIWGYWFPINKNLWTSSFALLTAGLSLCGVALCYWLIEILEVTAWFKSFEIFGRNPLLSYFLSGLFYGLQEFVKMPLLDGSIGNLKLWICERLFGSWLSPPGASLSYALCYLLICRAVMTALYRRKIFVKV